MRSLWLCIIAFMVTACSSSTSHIKDSGSVQPVIDTDTSVDTELSPDTGTVDDSSENTEIDTESDIGGLPSSIVFTAEQSVVITEVSAGHLAFPDNGRLSDGRVMLIYRQGAGHVESTGRIMKQFGGEPFDAEHWSPPEVLFDEPDMDDRDPSLTVFEDDSVAVTYFQYKTYSMAGSQLSLHQIFWGASQDAGETFAAFEQVSEGPMQVSKASLDADKRWVDETDAPIMVSACSSAAILYEGSIIIPAYGGPALNLTNLTDAPRSRISLYRLWDKAPKWEEIQVNPDEAADVWLMEPALLSMHNKDLLLHVRTSVAASPGGAGPLYQSRSTDGGATWSTWQSLGFVGHAPELLRLSNGVLISAFRWLNDAYTQEQVAFIFSLDEGTTWSDLIFIEDCGVTECGYPGAVELDGQRVLFTYYAASGSAIKARIYSFSTP